MLKRAIYAAVALTLAATITTLATERDVREAQFYDQIQPLIRQYCSDCHGLGGPAADQWLSSFNTTGILPEERERWFMVVRQLRSGVMPPAGAAQPSQSERTYLVEWIENRIIDDIDCVRDRRPGRVTLRRLNRSEYRNTVRDLLGVDYRPAAEFPADDVGYGFDNIGDVLALPPFLMEKYLEAAEQIATRAIETKGLASVDSVANEQRARQVIERLVGRAYRRPARRAELDRLVALVDLALSRGDTFQEGLQLALQAILVSPHFLFLVEPDPPPGRASRALSDHELAARLSYFLWSSMPDKELQRQARQGTLRGRVSLRQQVQRMLADPKSQALVDNFAAQWLQLRKFAEAQPNRRYYPAFTKRLRRDMRRETELFFSHIMRADRSVLEFLDCNYAFVNERLARHYGIGGVRGDSFRKVDLVGSARGGLLSQASMLTLTSNATRTSPVKRGKWILENVLGEPTPPPPPDAPSLAEDSDLRSAATLRQRLEQHRTNPSCAVCHRQMDELGIALENFDAIGGWRMFDGPHEIDASGQLPSGESFRGPRQLRRVLLETKKDQFLRCISKKMLTYALGRGLQHYDRCAVQKIVDELAKSGHRFSALVLAIVDSEPFQNRGAAPPQRTTP